MHKQGQAAKRRLKTTDSLEGTVHVSSVYRNRLEEGDVATATLHLPGAVPSPFPSTKCPKPMPRGELVVPVDTNFVASIYDKLSGNIYSRADLEEADAWRRKRRALRDPTLRDAFETPAPPPSPRVQGESEDLRIVHTPFATCDEKEYRSKSHFSLKVPREEVKLLRKKRLGYTLIVRYNNCNKTKLNRKNRIKEEVKPGIPHPADTTRKNNVCRKPGDTTVDQNIVKYEYNTVHTSSTNVLNNEGLRKGVNGEEETLLMPKNRVENEGNPKIREACQKVELPKKVTRTGKPMFSFLKTEQNLQNSEEDKVSRKQEDFTSSADHVSPQLLDSNATFLKDIAMFREKESSTSKVKRVSFRVEDIKSFRESLAIRDKALGYQVYEGGRTRKQGNTLGEKTTAGSKPCHFDDGRHLAREDMNWWRRLWQKFVGEITTPSRQVESQ